MLIVVEGNDGSGKSTLCKNLVEWFKNRGYSAVYTREPGGTPFAERMRTLVLNENLSPLQQALIISAGRVDHVEYLKSLPVNTIIVCDRYFFSTFAYQCVTDNLYAQFSGIQKALNFPQPDLTIYLQLPYSVAAERINSRSTNETQSVDFDNPDSLLYRDRNIRYLKSILEFSPSGFLPIDANVSTDSLLKVAIDAIRNSTSFQMFDIKYGPCTAHD